MRRKVGWDWARGQHTADGAEKKKSYSQRGHDNQTNGWTFYGPERRLARATASADRRYKCGRSGSRSGNAWLECIGKFRVGGELLPIGRLRAARGWLGVHAAIANPLADLLDADWARTPFGLLR